MKIRIFETAESNILSKTDLEGFWKIILDNISSLQEGYKEYIRDTKDGFNIFDAYEIAFNNTLEQAVHLYPNIKVSVSSKTMNYKIVLIADETAYYADKGILTDKKPKGRILTKEQVEENIESFFVDLDYEMTTFIEEAEKSEKPSPKSKATSTKETNTKDFNEQYDDVKDIISASKLRTQHYDDTVRNDINKDDEHFPITYDPIKVAQYTGIIRKLDHFINYETLFKREWKLDPTDKCLTTVTEKCMQYFADYIAFYESKKISLFKEIDKLKPIVEQEQDEKLKKVMTEKIKKLYTDVYLNTKRLARNINSAKASCQMKLQEIEKNIRSEETKPSE